MLKKMRAMGEAPRRRLAHDGLVRPTVRRSLGRRRKPEDRQAGQSIAELALVFPILAMILLSIFQFAFIYGAQIGITNATREAARMAATFETLNDTQAAANGDWTYNELVDNADALLRRNVQAYQPSRLVTPLTQVCYSIYSAADGTTQAKVKVEVVYSHPMLIPIVGQLLDGFDGATDGGLRIPVAEEIRVENQMGTVPSLTTNPTCITS